MAISATDEEIHRKLAAIMYEALRVPAEKVVPGARLFADYGAESIDILDIRFRIEETFGFKIQEGEIISSIAPDMTIEEFKELFTVGSIAAFIRQKLTEDV